MPAHRFLGCAAFALGVAAAVAGFAEKQSFVKCADPADKHCAALTLPNWLALLAAAVAACALGAVYARWTADGTRGGEGAGAERERSHRAYASASGGQPGDGGPGGRGSRRRRRVSSRGGRRHRQGGDGARAASGWRTGRQMGSRGRAEPTEREDASEYFDAYSKPYESSFPTRDDERPLGLLPSRCRRPPPGLSLLPLRAAECPRSRPRSVRATPPARPRPPSPPARRAFASGVASSAPRAARVFAPGGTSRRASRSPPPPPRTGPRADRPTLATPARSRGGGASVPPPRRPANGSPTRDAAEAGEGFARRRFGRGGCDRSLSRPRRRSRRLPRSSASFARRGGRGGARSRVSSTPASGARSSSRRVGDSRRDARARRASDSRRASRWRRRSSRRCRRGARLSAGEEVNTRSPDVSASRRPTAPSEGAPGSRERGRSS